MAQAGVITKKQAGTFYGWWIIIATFLIRKPESYGGSAADTAD
jgi:hypothetical protein